MRDLIFFVHSYRMYQVTHWIITHTPGIDQIPRVDQIKQGTNDSHTKLQYWGVGTTLIPETVR